MTAELRAALAEARQSNLRKDRLIAMLAHDLRGPLATMLLWETVLRTDADDRTRTRALDAIQRSARTQSTLVANLVDLARALQGTLRIPRHEIDITTVINTALERNATAPFERRIASALGAVAGDTDRILQILASMIAGVIECTTAGDPIVVAARRSQRMIAIEISARANESIELRPGGIELELARELATLLGGTLTTTRARSGREFGFKLSLCRFSRSADSPRHVAGVMEDHAHADRRIRAVGGGRGGRRARGSSASVRDGHAGPRSTVQSSDGDGPE